jgi:hypothetical protein
MSDNNALRQALHSKLKSRIQGLSINIPVVAPTPPAVVNVPTNKGAEQTIPTLPISPSVSSHNYPKLSIPVFNSNENSSPMASTFLLQEQLPRHSVQQVIKQQQLQQAKVRTKLTFDNIRQVFQLSEQIRLLQQKAYPNSVNNGVPYSPSSEQPPYTSDFTPFQYNYQQQPSNPVSTVVNPTPPVNNIKKREIEAPTSPVIVNKKLKDAITIEATTTSVVTQVTTSHSQGRFCLVEHPSVRQRKCYKGENR